MFLSTQGASALALRRLKPRLEPILEGASRNDRQAFEARLEAHFFDLFDCLLALYGSQYDFFFHLEEVLQSAARSWVDRAAELKELDRAREADPSWFQSESMVGGVCYVDLFGNTIKGICDQIPYFVELGITYVHLMPIFLAPDGNSDGGYAISSYRDVRPELGTMQDVEGLTAELRRHGISLVLDFVFNHTSDEHPWARRAQLGDTEAQEYYLTFPDRTMPDRYGRTLRDIFPDVRPGSFTYRADMDRWVWTTFNNFQWDLNYRNPAVFTRMAEEMLFLANRGAEILRLDALAFIWKEEGTSSESRPEAHLVVQAYNALARIAAPALLFKSEAIVHPDEVAAYISPGECQISYNPMLMALLWESLATRQVRLLHHALEGRFRIPQGTAWANYVRSHDDIGWTFDDGDAGALGINGFDHRQFLNAFYTGRFEGSFARGIAFGENTVTGDARIAGTCASLAGLERAITMQDEMEVDRSIARILLMYGVVLSIGGIPLVYLGDEIGILNDYAYVNDPAKADDSRWLHRVRRDSAKLALRHQPATVEGRIYAGFIRMIGARKHLPVLAGNDTHMVVSGNEHVLAFSRTRDEEALAVVANFSEREQELSLSHLMPMGLPVDPINALTGETHHLDARIVLPAYGLLWLTSRDVVSGVPAVQRTATS